MRTTIDSAGRVVIPKALRDQVGLISGAIDVEVYGAELRLRPLAGDELEEREGRLVIPETGIRITDEDVQAWRDADQK
jgi:AbrB family looped-hinge helix DNA binding protein